MISHGRGRPKKKVPRSSKNRESSSKITTQEDTGESEVDNPTIRDDEAKDEDGKGEGLGIDGNSDSTKEPSVEVKNNVKGAKLWVDIIRGNKDTTNGMSIIFVAPKVVDGEIEVEIENEDVESEMRFWECSLIMYVIGENLSMNVVKNYMIKSWKFTQLPEIFYND
ncbi:hypothetical protein KIW84_021785 [Lathyrus oleraceus]|uniref:Uncharacterized protein n=1 Tax=Pisum sativum TaxID=3888 RepID=A0A9D5B5T4_PEA|nr:hypothetical protein KIW84_021785 [Pisum sativum]